MTSQTYISYQNILLKKIFFLIWFVMKITTWCITQRAKKKKKSVDGIEMWTFINNRWH